MIENIEKKLMEKIDRSMEKGNRVKGYYTFKVLYMCAPLRHIRHIGRFAPSWYGFLATIMIFLVLITEVITLLIPEGVFASEVLKGQFQTCNIITNKFWKPLEDARIKRKSEKSKS